MRIIPSEIGRKAADTLGRRQDLEWSRAEFGIDPWTTFESCRTSSFYRPKLARLVVGRPPGASVKLCLRHRGALLPPAGTGRDDQLRTLADIAKNGTPSARVSAAIALLDRAYGKAPTFST